ncbi:HCL426Cp [Eremothecium sinecaudum]|uniref:Spindle pole body component n=1 Tax=Eremothecium sinecaudum TaxID=45286 RepID=A0A120K1T3_9SACH|nr:HCL426Cp [Eremothecium sinecaudum]AMD19725.1 HCL426Cp [Eremothecium sinecaudum]
MDLVASLYPCVLNMIPPGVSEIQVKRFVHDIAEAISSGSKEQTSRILEFYKSEMVRSPKNDSFWSKLEAFIQVLETFSSKEQIEKYLSVLNYLPKDVTPFKKRNSAYLTTDTLQHHNMLVSPSAAPSLYAESFENVEKYSDRRSAITSLYGGGMQKNAGNTTPLAHLSDPYYSNMISEAEVLKYISYTLLATTSSLFPVNNQTITIPCNAPNGESGVFHSIFEAALLYQYLSNRVEKLKSSMLSPLKVNFLSVVSQKLREYCRVVNGLTNTIGNETAKSIYTKIYTQILILRFYYRYLQKFEGFRGDQLISEFDLLRKHGDPLVKELASEVFSRLIDLYMEYLVYWVVSGQLKCAKDEFFVTRETTSNKNSLKFKILKDRIPSFIHPSVAKQIYTVGVSYIYLEEYIKDIEWASEFSKKYNAKFSVIPRYSISNAFFELINEQFLEITAYLNDVLRNRLYYRETITILKDILLMGRGDFINSIIKNTCYFLDEPVEQLQSYQLTKCLQDSVSRSSLRNYLNKSDNNALINKLDARLLESGHGSIGWDVFTLDYLIDPPLGVVLGSNSTGSKTEYLRIFNFLWKMKKNSFFFDEEWLNNIALMRDFRRIRRKSPLVRDIMRKMSMINALKKQVEYFNLKLQTYCFTNIIESRYREFQKKLSMKENNSQENFNIISLKNGSKVIDGILRPRLDFLSKLKRPLAPLSNSDLKQYNIDELAALHDEYLGSILEHKLLDAQNNKPVGKFTNQYFPVTIITLLDQMYDVVLTYGSLNRIVHEILIQLNLDTHDNLNDILSRFNLAKNNLVKQFQTFQNHSYSLIKDLRLDGNEDMAKLSRILR